MQTKAYGYSYVEPENVRYNRVLVDCDKSYDEIIKECNREKFGGKTMRRDGVPMIDTVFYYSPEKTPNLLCYFHKRNEHWKKEHAEWWANYQALPKEERNKQINAEYNWVKSWAQASEKWAEENLGQVVHCVLHCHEGTPHLDCKTLAIKEKEGKWIWAKREILGNPAHLSQMQSKYAAECGAKFGLERGEIKESGELRRHAETERHMAEATLASLDSQIVEKKEMWENIADTILQPFVEAQERLISTFESLKPEEQAKEQESVYDVLKSGNDMFNRGNTNAIAKATKTLNKKSDDLYATYLSIDDDDDFGHEL